MYSSFKRFMDVILSVFALIVLSPVMLIVAIIIKFTSPGPVIFVQKRVGKDGKVYDMYKFRSMCVGAEQQEGGVFCTKGDARVTPIGKFIRATSIDELPQLVNIIKGEMSLIGNRPYLPREKEDMKPYYYDIVKTKPGLTGYWQVNGRSNTTFKHRCKLEAEYSNNMGFRLDMKIFFKTFIVLFKGM